MQENIAPVEHQLMLPSARILETLLDVAFRCLSVCQGRIRQAEADDHKDLDFLGALYWGLYAWKILHTLCTSVATVCVECCLKARVRLRF